MAEPDSPRVSLILTVKNEEQTIDALLDSIVAQSYQPDEVIIVDGGSCDRTFERISSRFDIPQLIAMRAPGANISTGRNMALARTTGEFVAVTDAGVRLDPGWLARLIGPFQVPEREQPDVVGGFFSSCPETLFEFALGATTLPDVSEIEPTRFLPSSRSVALRRSLFEAGLRYPEWLDYCEDLVFDLRMKRAGARFQFEPRAVVWFRPRQSLAAYGRQYYLYARGDGKAGLFARRHALRYLTYFGLVPLVVLRGNQALRLAASIGAIFYVRRPIQRLLRRRHSEPGVRITAAILLVPMLRLVGDVAKMAGYPAGLAWRARRYGLRRTWRTIPERLDLTDRGVELQE